MKSKVIVVSTKAPGGIFSVVQMHEKHGVYDDFDALFFWSHDEGGALHRLIVYLRSVLGVFCCLVTAKVSLVHVHVSMRGSVIRKLSFIILAKLFGKPVLFHLHGSEFKIAYETSSSVYRFFVRLALKLSTVVFVLSESWATYIADLTKTRVVVVPNFVTTNEAESSSAKVSLSSRQKNLLFLGYLGQRKGIYDLVWAVKKARDAGVPVKLKVGGNGEVESVKALVSQLGLEHAVDVLGWINGEDRDQLLSEADIFLLPSYNEGLPMAILEAMSARVAVISTTVGGIPDLVTSGVNGLLVSPGDVDALSRAICDLCSNEDLMSSIADNGFDSYEKDYSPNVVPQRIREIFLAIANEVENVE